MTGGAEADAAPAVAPLFSVVHGHPTDEEVAALVAVLTATGGGVGPRTPAPHRSTWADPARRMQPTLAPGPDVWRLSARA